MSHRERHRINRAGWLRAAVLGANDGLISTSSLLVGVASANPGRSAILLSGMAGLVAGALSMAAGEYVSVSSQADTEMADLQMEQEALDATPELELVELAGIYEERGLTPELAMQVAVQLSARDVLGAHARDELGITDTLRARPVQAALTSAAAFSLGAASPLVVTALVAEAWIIQAVAAASLFLALALGWIAAQQGGASGWRGAVRVGFWGAVAMLGTALVGRFFGTQVS
jgi:VIT1/CCC1 family predicted Fe2+/Mn2+ transporter